MPVEQVALEVSSYLSNFERMAKVRPVGARWLHELRDTAMECFTEQGFPTTREEDWKFTNLNALTRTSFELAGQSETDLAEDLPCDGPCLVFVNGHFMPALSGKDVMAGNLSAAPPAFLERHLARYADYRKQPFVALNTAFLGDGAFVHVPAKAIQDVPIHVVHISTGSRVPHVSHPRTLIVVEAGAHASVTESYIGSEEYFTNAVTEIVAGEGAVVEHCKLQIEAVRAFHISTIHVRQARGSVFTSRNFAFGGALARTVIDAVLEEGCECTLNGLYKVTGKQHVDTRTSIDHAKPHAASHELYKGILDGHSSAVFNGKIIVRKDAQKTDAKQTNKNLVLSEDATINTKPQLEIFADDVRCTHGATIGQLDPESIFYMRSRGIDLEHARMMLLNAFAHEVIDGIKSESFREYVGRRL
jgi:Fe-S cluster assembly protein SufD